MRRERLSISILLLVTAAVLSLGRVAPAQMTAAAIHGTVTDSSGAVVPTARVTALNTATGIATPTRLSVSGSSYIVSGGLVEASGGIALLARIF